MGLWVYIIEFARIYIFVFERAIGSSSRADATKFPRSTNLSDLRERVRVGQTKRASVCRGNSGFKRF